MVCVCVCACVDKEETRGRTGPERKRKEGRLEREGNDDGGMRREGEAGIPPRGSHLSFHFHATASRSLAFWFYSDSQHTHAHKHGTREVFHEREDAWGKEKKE